MSLGEKRKPTRTELKKLNSELDLTKSGHELLQLKNESMLIEIIDTIKKMKQHNLGLIEDTKKADDILLKALSLHGLTNTKYLAASVNENKDIKIEKKHMMGVILNRITAKDFNRKPTERGYNLRDSSIELDRAADSFEKLVPKMLMMGELNSNKNILKKEIKKTNRKVNTLERIIIPKLTREKRTIISKIDEKTREDFIRIKQTKNRI